jgi:hypothetical protein
MASNPLTDAQKRVRSCIDKATSTVLAYTAKEVPPLGNLTLEGMVEELGYMNESRKALEKVEKIIKERIKSQLGDKTEVKTDNFTMTYKAQDRTALDQTTAKEKLEAFGCLE